MKPYHTTPTTTTMRRCWILSTKMAHSRLYVCGGLCIVILLNIIFRNRSDIVRTTSNTVENVGLPWLIANDTRGAPSNLILRAETPIDKPFVQMSMKQRAAYVRARCVERSEWINYTSLTGSVVMDTILSNDEYNVTMCFNRKVASTNIRRVFYMLANRDVIEDIHDIKKSDARHEANKEEIELEKIRNVSHIKVMFVRDPLERLLSAYRDNRGFEDLRVHRDLSFKEFLQAIAMETEKWENIHMVSFVDACHPCEVDYDFIGMTETFDNDMTRILHKINADFVNLPSQNITGYTVTSKEEMTKYLKDVSPRLLDFIYNKYRLDYYTFGFTHPKHWIDDIQ